VPARAPREGQTDRGVVLTEELLLPDQIRDDAIFDLVPRRRDLSVVEVGLGVERVGLEADEAVVGTKLLDVLVGSPR
jgi:hypothetical protein